MASWRRWNGSRKRKGVKRIRLWGIWWWGEWELLTWTEEINYINPEAEERAEGNSTISY